MRRLPAPFLLIIAFALAVAYGAVIDASPANATSISVATEGQYRAALTSLSSDPSGPHTVTLGADITFATTGDPVYSGDQDLTIDGAGHTIDANSKGRGFYTASPGITVTVRNLTVTNATPNYGSGTAGGGLAAVNADLVIIDSVLIGNHAQDGAAASASHGDLTLIRSTVTNNIASDDIGGVHGFEVWIQDSTISHNEAHGYQGDGAGVYGAGPVTVINSTIHDNVLTSGTGPYARGGGGIRSNGPLTLIYSTVTNNSAASGRGSNIRTVGENANLISFGSVISSPGNENCVIDGTTVSSYTYDDDGTCGLVGTGDTSGGADPALGALADNGGPTYTQLPNAGSSLIDAIPSASCDETYTTDQRGLSRPQGAFCDIGAVEVFVPNLPPVADANGPYLFPLDAGPFDGTGSSDPDGDPLVYDWDYGDGPIATDVGPTPHHTYADAGIYDVCVTVTDLYGENDTDCAQTVIFDPSAGFVTGGGWFYSAAGSYSADGLAEGKATFGFVSKYKKGASTPDGNTQFVFHAGNLTFSSVAYDWLVVTGDDVARFKGTGTVNAEGGYKFMIWAGDSNPDTFRIKIWTEDDSGVATDLYDNGSNQIIDGGSIVVHTKKK